MRESWRDFWDKIKCININIKDIPEREERERGKKCVCTIMAWNFWTLQVAQLVKNPPAMQETWVWSLHWEDLLRRIPTPVFWPGEFHGLYNPWGHKESDMTERLSLSQETQRVPNKINLKRPTPNYIITKYQKLQVKREF